MLLSGEVRSGTSVVASVDSIASVVGDTVGVDVNGDFVGATDGLLVVGQCEGVSDGVELKG